MLSYKSKEKNILLLDGRKQDDTEKVNRISLKRKNE